MKHNIIIILTLIGSTLCVKGMPDEEPPRVIESTHQEDADSVTTQSLDEIVITKALTEHEGNRDIITVTEAMRKGTKDTGDLLGRISGVYYNPITTELLYRGSDNVLILVDGVEKDPSYIKRLNPGRFDKITITNSPTGMFSKYDAVIDLHLKPLYKGYEGVILAEAVLAPGDGNGKGNTLRSTREEGQFTYTRNRLNIDFYTAYRFSQFGLSDLFELSYPLNGIWEKALAPKGKEPNQYNKSSNYSASLAADYDFSKNHSVSVKVWGSPSSARESHEYMLERTYNDLGFTRTISEHKNTDTHGRLDLSGGVWYRGQVGAWVLRANASYTDVGFKWVNGIDMSSGYTLNDQRRIKARYGTAAAEASRYVGNKWYLTLSNRFVTSEYSAKQVQTGELLSETHDIRNTFDASLQWFISRKVSMGVNAGLSVFSNGYEGLQSTHFTPQGGVQAMWQPSQKVLLRLDYRLNSQYPSLSSIQDYGQFTDSLIYFRGEPTLKPALTHQLSLSATLLQKISIETRYIHISDMLFNYYGSAFGSLPSGQEAPYVLIKPVNGSSDKWSMNLSYADSFGSHWLVSVSMGANYTRASFADNHSSRMFPNYSWYAVYQTLGNTLQIYLSSNLRSNLVIGPQTDMWELEDGYALCLSKTFFRQRLQVLAMWTLPFHITSGRWHGGTQSEAYTLKTLANNQFRTDNNIQLTLVYRFQGGQSVKKYNRQSESVEI